MDRSVKWRYPNPFRVTPPFGGVGHWEGSGYHWEQSGSGYAQVAGDEWYEFITTVDEGYNEVITKTGVKPFLHYSLDSNLYDEGDSFKFETYMTSSSGFGDGMNYIISNVDVEEFELTTDIFGNNVEPYSVYYYKLELERDVHHVILIDYWNAWKFENLQWKLIESGIRRNHV